MFSSWEVIVLPLALAEDPFPDYYLEKANDQLALGVDFKGICEAVLESMQ